MACEGPSAPYSWMRRLERIRWRSAAEQEVRQVSRCHDVVSEAELWPPPGYARIGYQLMVKSIKDAVSRQGSHHEPERALEPNQRRRKEDGDDCGIDTQGVAGAPHDGKQGVVGGNDGHDGGIERSIAIKANDRGHPTNREREARADQICQCALQSWYAL